MCDPGFEVGVAGRCHEVCLSLSMAVAAISGPQGRSWSSVAVAAVRGVQCLCSSMAVAAVSGPWGRWWTSVADAAVGGVRHVRPSVTVGAHVVVVRSVVAYCARWWWVIVWSVLADDDVAVYLGFNWQWSEAVGVVVGVGVVLEVVHPGGSQQSGHVQVVAVCPAFEAPAEQLA